MAHRDMPSAWIVREKLSLGPGLKEIDSLREPWEGQQEKIEGKKPEGEKPASWQRLSIEESMEMESWELTGRVPSENLHIFGVGKI